MGNNSITGSGDVFEVIPPGGAANYYIKRTIPLTWPGYNAAVSTTVGTVPPDNAATKPKPAGATSKVGASTSRNVLKGIS